MAVTPRPSFVYNVHMKRYTVAAARKRIAEVLDEAEKGRPVVIERKGVRFRLSLDEAHRRPPRRVTLEIEILDPAVEAGVWTWETRKQGGLAFVPSSKRKA